MPRIDVRTRATRVDILRSIYRIPQEIRGDSASARATLTRCGLSLLGRISKAYLVKARGGVDEAGERWTPLSPRTRPHTHTRTRSHRGGSRHILIDTKALLTSLTPSTTLSSSSPPTSPSFTTPPGQVFRVGRGEVTVGTNLPYAIVHHKGDRSGRRNIPQRRLWPIPGRWPSSWWQDITDQVRQRVVDIAGGV